MSAEQELVELEKKIVLIDDKLEVIKNEHFKILGMSVEVYKAYINKKEEVYTAVRNQKSAVEQQKSILENQKHTLESQNQELQKTVEEQRNIIERLNKTIAEMEVSSEEEDDDDDEEQRLDNVIKTVEKQSVPVLPIVPVIEPVSATPVSGKRVKKQPAPKIKKSSTVNSSE